MAICDSNGREIHHSMTLTHITVSGTMLGTAWGSLLGDDTADMEMEFSMQFMPAKPDGLHKSPWTKEWEGIREALMEATYSGDLIGQCGSVLDAEITFHYAGDGERYSRTFGLKPGKATADLWEDAQ